MGVTGGEGEETKMKRVRGNGFRGEDGGRPTTIWNKSIMILRPRTVTFVAGIWTEVKEGERAPYLEEVFIELLW